MPWVAAWLPALREQLEQKYFLHPSLERSTTTHLSLKTQTLPPQKHHQILITNYHHLSLGVKPTHVEPVTQLFWVLRKRRIDVLTHGVATERPKVLPMQAPRDHARGTSACTNCKVMTVFLQIPQLLL